MEKTSNEQNNEIDERYEEIGAQELAAVAGGTAAQRLGDLIAVRGNVSQLLRAQIATSNTAISKVLLPKVIRAVFIDDTIS